MGDRMLPRELQELREDIFRVTASRMAELIGIPRKIYKKYENGTFAMPFDVAERIRKRKEEMEAGQLSDFPAPVSRVKVAAEQPEEPSVEEASAPAKATEVPKAELPPVRRIRRVSAAKPDPVVEVSPAEPVAKADPAAPAKAPPVRDAAPEKAPPVRETTSEAPKRKLRYVLEVYEVLD